MYGLDKDARDLLGQRAVLSGGAAPERFLQLIGNIRPYEYTFTVCHTLRKLLLYE